MIAAVALTVAAAALVGAVEYARICVVRARFARAVHASASAVPSGLVPRRGGRGTNAGTHPTPATVRVGAGTDRRPASVSPTASRTAPTTDRGMPVVGASIGPAGYLHHTSGRPGHHDGPGAA